jgi:hypothetical protein
MEPNKRRADDGRSDRRRLENKSRNPGSKQEFEGMNFEQQRASYKNSDGAGVAGKEEQKQNAPKKD